MSTQIKNAIEELGTAFEEFKESYDQRAKEETERIDELEKKLGRPIFKDGTKQNKDGGKSLNHEGTVKLYTPQQKLMADMRPDEDEGVDLGSFLRAAVDKPKTADERSVLQKSVGSSGYSMPTRVARELIDKLRAVNPVIAAGGRSISIEGLDTTKFVKITSDPDAVWHTELTDESLSDPSFDSVDMKPKTVLALTEISRELLQDSSNIEQALTSSFVGSLNSAIMEATFTGSAANDNEPTGLATTVTQTETYTNGGSPDWSNFVNANTTLHTNNVPENGRSHILAPDVWQTLALATDDNGRYQDAPSFIRNIPNHTSSGVTAGQAYVGDFSNVVYGYRLNITLEQFPGASATKYASLWIAVARLDMAVFRPNALVRIEEAEA